MSVIAELRIPAEKFELGRILDVERETIITIETMVPLGEKAVPFFSVHNEASESFEETVRNHPSVLSIEKVNESGDTTLYTLDWDVSQDVLFEGLYATEAHILSATGTAQNWQFELQFSSHKTLTQFREFCSDAQIPLDVDRVYNPMKPGSGPWYGLSELQRKTLVHAVRNGYYAIPRQQSTQDLADEFGISDQAVTERLRRAISTLVENTLIAAEEEEKRTLPPE